jgi:cell wall-associated NlpC family hydrolase
MRAATVLVEGPGMASFRFFVARIGLISFVFAALVQVSAPVAAAATPKTEYEMVYATVVSKLGDQWKFRATGPNEFDCSGLVWYAFHEHALQDRIGGYRSVAGYWNWFKERGLISRDNPKLGDLVVWGANQHIGLYIGNGNAISTLVTKHGVSVHPVKGYLGIRFKAYLHTTLTRPAV